MSHCLLLEPFGGLAGDMLLAALVDLGRDELTLEHLAALARDLVGDEARLRTEETRRAGLRGRRLVVETPESEHPPHRRLDDLEELVRRADLSPATRERSQRCLRRLAEAEARVHGTSVDEVHFHEIGAVDTLIDVCGALHAVELLGVERVFASRPYVGDGTVRTAHGEMPVPAPATAELLRGRTIQAGPGGERVTPTGAALLCELVGDVSGDGGPEPPPAMRTLAIGYGAGSRDPKSGPPNLLRVSLGREAADDSAGEGALARVCQLELNLDDATGEEIGFLTEELLRSGALDVWTQPIQMKKGRPGTLVALLCREERRAELERAAFRHSPTLGVRWSTRWRTECARDEITIRLHGETVRVKRRLEPGHPGRDELSPEYEDLARLARRLGRSLRELEDEALSVARAELGS